MVKVNGCSLEEAKPYIEYLENKYNRKLLELNIKFDGEYVDLDGKFEPVKFDRVRRITGYLVPSPDHWVDSKKQELRNRVKHSMEEI